MSKITVSYYKKQFVLPLKKNGNLNFSDLKQYCPKAIGLCYDDEDGKTHGLASCMGEIIIDPKIRTYDVHINEDSSPRNNFSANKRRRIEEILANIHGGKENDHLNIEADKSSVKQSYKSPKKLTRIGKPVRTLHVGWLHRSTPDNKYQQINSQWVALENSN